jgi:hypothetical protein
VRISRKAREKYKILAARQNKLPPIRYGPVHAPVQRMYLPITIRPLWGLIVIDAHIHVCTLVYDAQDNIPRLVDATRRFNNQGRAFDSSSSRSMMSDE